jgi:hypothetical protein
MSKDRPARLIYIKGRDEPVTIPAGSPPSSAPAPRSAFPVLDKANGLRGNGFAPVIRSGHVGRLANNFLLKDRCALPDQMSFVLTFPWGPFIFVKRNRDCTNKNKIAIFVFSVTTKHFPHNMPL